MPWAIPDLVDNRGVTLANVLVDLLRRSEAPRLDVVVAFFNLKGLEALEPAIQNVQSLRLLLGKEQEQSFVLSDRLLAELESAASHGEEAPLTIRKWREFIARPEVEVRRYTRTFVHGKAYIVEPVPGFGAVGSVGSSNFTGGGLVSNLELNAVLKQQSAVQELKRWFEELWREAEDWKAPLLELLDRFTCTYSPYEIYIKVLYEALKDRFDRDLSERDQRPSPIALTDFQHDGYLAAKEILENYGGVLIADSVGLGKTYLALKLLDDYAYRERQTALIVCPAAMADTVWRPLLQQYAIPYELVSMERVSQKDFPVGQYADYRVIVVDESHNFRNSNTNRWENLFRLLSNGDPEKKLILLTATPVNNTVFDLFHQLRLITRDVPEFFLAAGIPDLRAYFQKAEQNKDALYEVLEAIAVRRSRHFIRQNYPEAVIDGQPIRFPDRRLHKVTYSLSSTYGSNLYQRIADAIENLLLAPYQVEAYRRELVKLREELLRSLLPEAAGEDEAEPSVQRLQRVLGWSAEQAWQFMMIFGRQIALAHILRVLYLKRLESSMEALRISLRRLHNFMQAFAQALAQGRLLDSRQYRRWLQMEGDDDEEQEGLDLNQFIAELPELSADRYDVEAIRNDVQRDLDMLNGLLGELEGTGGDEKLKRLKELLTSPELRGKKIVVFTYFRDTARYLYRQLTGDTVFLEALGHSRLSIVDSGVKPGERKDRIERFAPQANRRQLNNPEQEIDLLISTDVLSEGQNLQDAGVLVNYDLHWNPVRLVQRIGRLDRIGSPHPVVDVYNFFPEEELESLLRILQRLHDKLNAINRTIGLDASVLGETPNPMDFNILRRLAQEEAKALEELEAQSELVVGEFLLQDLLRFLKEAGEARLKQIPLGVGTAKSGHGEYRGFFAAFRNVKTNEHHWLFLDEGMGHKIVEVRIDAIRAIRCGPSEEVVPLPEDFDPREAIARLRRHLWNRIRQQVIAQPSLPAVQRRVVDWLHTLPPSAERNDLLRYFEERPLAGSALSQLRSLWQQKSQWQPKEWTKRLKEFMNAYPHPIQPARAPVPLPEETDLECVAWVVVR